MKEGDTIPTPRFCSVRIREVLSAEEASQQGYSEPTHYRDSAEYDIYGKHTGTNMMVFAAVKKNV